MIKDKIDSYLVGFIMGFFIAGIFSFPVFTESGVNIIFLIGVFMFTTVNYLSGRDRREPYINDSMLSMLIAILVSLLVSYYLLWFFDSYLNSFFIFLAIASALGRLVTSPYLKSKGVS